jgi:ubiquinone/menaquinone biosynthesis C-methylase UbiE
MKTLVRGVVNRFPRFKSLLQKVLRLALPDRGVSNHYVELAADEVGGESARLRSAWKDTDMPAKQRKLVDGQLALYRRGTPVEVFDVLVNSLRKLQGSGPAMGVLEVGCSSGYYAEVFQIANLGVDYAGCDYSDAFVAMARDRYPSVRFDVADATDLAYADGSYDVVVSGCCLLHIPEYKKAVAETVRVARQFAIFHRTPVVIGQPNKHYRKQAYGVETVEIHFNEPAFLQLLADSGLELLNTHTLDETISQGVGSATRTYVCQKRLG